MLTKLLTYGSFKLLKKINKRENEADHRTPRLVVRVGKVENEGKGRGSSLPSNSAQSDKKNLEG